MALAIGSRIGTYEIVAPLGAGGMGEVYRARDTKLARDVALKVLPTEFAIDPERLARFKREAQVLASLNHPNVAAIYGCEESRSGGSSDPPIALVLELVEGPTLADRITQGAIPIDEALPIARQIAEALEAAHEQGIIHRDLKPANIKVRADGTVKVLDFGLAKLIEGTDGPPEGGHYDRSVRLQPDLTASPTITTPAMTMAGVILGTAGYMSPEQAKGRVADKRSDIWAFGCVLFEMLTGKRPFDGDDVSDTLAAVLRAEPEWSGLPIDTPDRIHGLLRRCLRKDPQKRLPHVAMVRYEIDEASTESAVPPSMPSPLREQKPSFVRRAMPVAIGILLTASVTSGVWWFLRPQPPQPTVHRFAIPLADGEEAAAYPFRSVAISRDGSQIVYAAQQRLNLRSMSNTVPTVIAGTDNGSGIGSPTFSPDGRSIAYVSGLSGTRGSVGGATINTISVNGGVPATVAQVRAGNVPGLSWSDDGIIYSDLDAGIFRVPPNGGKPERLVALGAGESTQGPVMLPGGRAILFALAKGRDVGTAPTLELWDTAKIVVQPLPAGERTTLIEGGSDPQYLPTGHLLYARGGTIYIAPFDVERLKVGPPSPIVQGVARVVAGRASTGAAQFSVSSTGSVVYVEGPASVRVDQPKIVIVDRAGNVEPLNLPPQSYERPRVSPDGTQLALGSDDSGGANILIYDLSGKTSIRPLTFQGKNRFPVWSPDGTRIAYQSDREGDLAIYTQPSNGSAAAQRLTKPEMGTTHGPDSWSSDGKYLLYSVSKDGMYSLWVYSFETKKGTPFGDVRSPRLMSPTFSPRGDWVAYTTTTNQGQNLVFAEPFPATGSKYRVGVGARPQWSPDGSEVFFYRTDATFVETVTTRPSFNVGNPVALPFNVYAGRGPGGGRDADIFPDGKRFVAEVTSGDPRSATSIRQFHVVLNWFEELKQRVK